MKATSVARGIIAGGIAVAAAAGLYATPAFAAVQANGSIQPGTPFDLGPDPNGLPSSCQFSNGDANFVFQSGSFVSHDTSNANGDWGGLTAQGTAVFREGNTPIDQGHLTIWEGGGNNSPTRGQTEGGMTLNFSGQNVQIHVNFHGTLEANSTSNPIHPMGTANVLNATVTCS